MTIKIHGLMLIAVLATGCGDCGDDPAATDAGTDAPTDAGSDGIPPLDAPGFYRSVPTVVNRDLDILFVVDDSASMAAEQAQLAASFPAMITVLEQVIGGLPNLHIGVVSSDVGASGASGIPTCPGQGDDGNLLTGLPSNNCATQYGLQGSFISDVSNGNGTRTRNYNPNTMNPLFACMAQLGTSGCGFEMHLESMWRALQPGKNPGFYRTGAHLAVIVFADEDDCSTEMGAMFGDPTAGLTSPLGPRTSFRCHEFGVVCDNDTNPRTFGTKLGCKARDNSLYQFEVEKYVTFLRTLKPEVKLVSVAGILGLFNPAIGNLDVVQDPGASAAQGTPSVYRSCGFNPNDEHAGASPPVRLSKFLSAFPARTTQTSICDVNLTDALAEIGTQIKTAIGNPCIDTGFSDVNPNLPGLQHQCTVADVVDPDGPNRRATPVPACETVVQAGPTCAPGTAATPCWCLVPELQRCPATGDNPGSLAIAVHRGGGTPGQVLEIYCAP